MKWEKRAQAKRAFRRATIELKPLAFIVVEIQLVAPPATTAAIGGGCDGVGRLFFRRAFGIIIII